MSSFSRTHKWKERFTYPPRFLGLAKFRAKEVGVRDTSGAGNKARRLEYSARNFRFRRLIGTRNPEMSDDARARKEVRRCCTIVISMKATRIMTSRHRETIKERVYVCIRE